MIAVTEAARSELEARLSSNENWKYIRLQMCQSCYMKVKVTLEETIQPNDTEWVIDELHFIVDNNHIHYFAGKKLDFLPDSTGTGFKEFDVTDLEPDDSALSM